MGWVYRRKNNKNVHICNLPAIYGYKLSLSDLWRCDECNKLWQVGQMYVGDNSPIGYHPAGFTWQPAGIVQRIFAKMKKIDEEKFE